MTEYTAADIKVLANPFDHIRRYPYLYLWNGIASPENILRNFGPYLAALGCLPMSIDRRGDWWLVSAQQDWMADVAPEVLFSRICTDPRLGVNGYRPEILIPAFSEAVFTAAESGFSWINRGQASVPMNMEKPFTGRLVGFLTFEAMSPVNPPA